MKHYQEKITHGTNEFPFSDYYYKNIVTPRMVTPLHWHIEIEILFVEQGTVKVQIAHECHFLKEGDALFVNSKELHSLFATETPCTYHAFVFGENMCRFSKEHFYTNEIVRPLFDGSASLPRSISRADSNYEIIVDKLNKLAHQTSIAANNRFFVLFQTLELLYILKEQYLFSSKKNNAEIHKCIDYLEEHYSEQLELNDVAALVHMTPSYFCTYFKKHTGYTPFEQLNLIRIKHAMTLLRDKNKKITTIATECGFNSISFFNRKFHEIMNMSPREYQKSM